jgi:uncharacterized protein (TIGR03437 family)
MDLMLRAWMALAAVAFCGAASGQAPSYSTAQIVNASDYSPGPFAPNSMLTIFGSNLANFPPNQGVGLPDVGIASVPIVLGGVSVYIDNSPVPLLYVSASQINLLIPPNEIAGDVPVQVDRQGTRGPITTITLVNAAPALFLSSPDYALALDYNANSSTVTSSAPAQPGDLIILYAAGLGSTSPNPVTGEIPGFQALISAFSSFRVLLNGKALDPTTVPYAGQAPGFPGVYQVNFYLPGPGNFTPNPQIQLAIGSQVSAPGIILAAQ